MHLFSGKSCDRDSLDGATTCRTSTASKLLPGPFNAKWLDYKQLWKLLQDQDLTTVLTNPGPGMGPGAVLMVGHKRIDAP
jgi:hypothetical protein